MAECSGPLAFGRPDPSDDRLQPDAVLVGGEGLDHRAWVAIALWITRADRVRAQRRGAAVAMGWVAEQRGWEALRAIGWTIQRPRPRHARAASAEEQAEYKKASRKPSPKRQCATPAQ